MKAQTPSVQGTKDGDGREGVSRPQDGQPQDGQPQTSQTGISMPGFCRQMNAMLKHEDNPQTQSPSPSAAQVRVTPEELAAAVTALQIRKEGQPGTIAIGDAVEELGLDVTPEEVLAEVQARRRLKPKKGRDYWALACAGACFLLPFVFGRLSQALNTAMPATSFDATATPAAYQLQLDSDHLQVGDAASKKLVLMSEVGDDQPVHSLLYNSQEWEDYYSNNNSTSWTLIKHGGKVYLRGWIMPVSEKLMQQDGVRVENRRASENSIAITLPLTGFSVKPGAITGSDQETTEFHAEDVHLDKHAYEKW